MKLIYKDNIQNIDNSTSNIHYQQLLNSIKSRYFAGYHQIKEMNQSKEHVEQIVQEEESNYFPLSQNFNIFYKTKYLKPFTSKFNCSPSFKVLGVSKHNDDEFNNINTPSETMRVPKNTFLTGSNSQKDLTNKIFLNERERKVYTPYSFIMVDKCNDKTKREMMKSNSQKSFYGQTILKKQLMEKGINPDSQSINHMSDERFLFILSHKDKHKPDCTKNNYNQSKSLYHAKAMTYLHQKQMNEAKDDDESNQYIKALRNSIIGKGFKMKTLMKGNFYNKYKFNQTDFYLRRIFYLLSQEKQEEKLNISEQVTTEKEGNDFIKIDDKSMDLSQKENIKGVKVNKKINTGRIINKSKSCNNYNLSKIKESSNSNCPFIQNELISKSLYWKDIIPEGEKKKFEFIIPKNSHLLENNKKTDHLSIFRKTCSNTDKIIINLLEKGFTKEEMKNTFTKGSFPLVYYDNKS